MHKYVYIKTERVVFFSSFFSRSTEQKMKQKNEKLWRKRAKISEEETNKTNNHIDGN